VNASGQVAFQTNLTGGSSTSGIFVGAPGLLQAAALQGGTAPGGGTFSGFGQPLINAPGHVAFLATTTNASSPRGIFAGAPGSLRAAALQNLLAPDGNGATFSGFNWFALDSSDDVVFLANLAGAGVTSANNLGLYLSLPGGSAEVIRTGDIVNTGSGLHTVSGIGVATGASGQDGLSSNGSGGQDGQAMSFNDAGTLVFKLSFTDGTSGIFSTTSVPEPSSAFLTVAGLFAAVRLCKRRAK
jgi:hypothetical protein